ncbi:MAG: hypothetical protein D8B59_11435 [Bacteroidetes bacterium]|jgi:hypothetical protein|nr:conserved hypothetical protein [Bacteroidetes oral taxon 274 str. F0058]RKV84249.1 MAG: hypothetical protein D8B59_11435 [Bacteroidota bacterium]
MDIYRNVAVISGLEPHRTILQERLLKLFARKAEKSLIVEGKPADTVRHRQIYGVDVVSHLDDTDLAFVLQNADNIYCRSGYSTLMDLYALGINRATLIPTPGQTEQEYLAEYFANKGFEVMKQWEV